MCVNFVIKVYNMWHVHTINLIDNRLIDNVNVSLRRHIFALKYIPLFES